MYKKIIYMAIIVLSIIAAPIIGNAETIGADRVILVKEIHGVAFHQPAGEGGWLPTELKMLLSEHDVVKTGENSGVTLLFKGASDTTVTMRPDSVLRLSTVNKNKADDETELFLELGSVLVKAEKLQGDSKFKVRTHRQIVGIRGTEFEVSVD